METPARRTQKVGMNKKKRTRKTQRPHASYRDTHGSFSIPRPSDACVLS